MITLSKSKLLKFAELSELQIDGRSEFAYTNRLEHFAELVLSDLDVCMEHVTENGEPHQQLAAEQLNNKLLRDALEAVIKVLGYESGIPVEALSTQASTEALDKYVAEKVKEARRTAEYWKENHLAGNVQITTLTRQRDLAVKALNDLLEFAIDSTCGKTHAVESAREAIAAIKESEAK